MHENGMIFKSKIQLFKCDIAKKMKSRNPRSCKQPSENCHVGCTSSVTFCMQPVVSGDEFYVPGCCCLCDGNTDCGCWREQTLSWWEPTVWVTWVMVPAHICYLVTRVCCTYSWLLPCNWNAWFEIVFVHPVGTLCGWRDVGGPGSKLVAMHVPWFEIQVMFPSPGRSGTW